MGSKSIAQSDEALHLRYADQFQVRQSLVYLNHAAVAPLCRPAAEAIQWLAADAMEFGSLHYDRWLETYEGLRVAAARLIGAHRNEIALVKNTSEGIATVAMGIEWRPGDKIVAFREEFPANYYPWKRLEAAGVRVEWLSYLDPLDRVDQACRGARLLAISFVQYLSGYRADLEAIGEICHRHGCAFLVDAIQGLGAFPVDVRRAHIDALAADGHKWLLGPEGCGILFVAQQFQGSVEPKEFGWTNVAHFADYASRDMALRPDAGRYECGTLTTVACYGLRASIEFLLQVGVEAIAPAVQRLGDLIAAGVQAQGYEVLGQRTPATGAGIASFRKQGIEAGEIVNRLKAARVSVAARQGWVRVSPHFYISPDEIGQMLEALP
ncbi:MAG TPA: aminotransferase class V-fold PLP-dependent enzyme [Bryobacteraceae bacterium]|nr:aminotransferase class V-fold PLP-dependent enzyme [Bryobacteraceae bacterium]